MEQGLEQGGIEGGEGNAVPKEAAEFARFELEQAKDHFGLVEGAPLDVLPLLLFYGLFHLAKGICALRLGRPIRERVHGLTCRFPKGREPSSLSDLKVGVKRKGAFRIFERLYEPHPIPPGQSFDLGHLVAGCEEAESLHPLSRHYLALFGLSIVSRYEPQVWRSVLEGRDPLSGPVLSYLSGAAEECLELASQLARIPFSDWLGKKRQKRR